MPITFLSTDAHAVNYLRQLLSDRYSSISSELKSCISFEYSSAEIKSIDDLAKYDVLVSPCNSYGDLSGGIDKVYYNLLGKKKLQKRVIDDIKENCFGEVHVGSSTMISLSGLCDGNLSNDSNNSTNSDSNSPKHLIIAPTMVVPTSLDAKSRNPYLFTRAVFRRIICNKLADKNILCPIPCIGVGGMDYRVVAKQMKLAIQSMHQHGLIYDIHMSDKKEESSCPYNFIYANLPIQNMKMANTYMLDPHM